MEPILSIENISKRYEINRQKGGYVAMRDVLANVARHPLEAAKYRFGAMTGKITKEDFWALKDVSFEVYPGEAIGIIGSNGSGKSTLLKILSKITPPTSGEIKICGRVASLLEVGTGFHPELTGRENIFLNGAILGMSQKQIKANFDAIVDFSGVEQFIDTPVKRYSSGMYVRLAFAVAAHLEPDILLVDEVLAVGDAEFQKKCLGKMGEITKSEGRTVVFISHNLDSINALCNKCLLLKKGQIVDIGKPAVITRKYLDSSSKIALGDEVTPVRKGSGKVIVDSFEFVQSGDKVNFPVAGEDTTILIKYHSIDTNVSSFNFSISINEHLTQRGVYFIDSRFNEYVEKVDVKSRNGKIEVYIPKFPLALGVYSVNINFEKSGEILDWVTNFKIFNVDSGNYYKNGKLPNKGQVNSLLNYEIIK